MSHQVNQLLFPASSEFTALCRFEVSNLQERLKADHGAVYLTKELQSGTRQLIPIVIYPEADSEWEEAFEESTIIESEENNSLSNNTSSELSSIPMASDDLPAQLTTAQQNSIPDLVNQQNQHQIVFPLLHENVMMGLLVIARQQAQWSEWEFTQIQRSAETLALACVLDQRQGLFQQKLRQQQWKQNTQREHLDELLHQLRNPLMALRTFGKLLLKRFNTEENQKTRSLTENLMRESDRLQQLLQEMGDYLDQIGKDKEQDLTIETETTAIPEGDSNFKSLPPSHALTLEAVQIPDILNPILESTSAIAQEKQIELKTEIPQQLPSVKANTKALQEVLSNLLDNAVKYTPENGTIEVFVTQEKPQWQGIVIRDNGSGIPEQDQPKIFERHYRGIQSESEIPGTGLGLAIAKDYVEHMGGDIELISPATPPENPMQGTAFIVWLANEN